MRSKTRMVRTRDVSPSQTRAERAKIHRILGCGWMLAGMLLRPWQDSNLHSPVPAAAR